jgi:hypothetical protein
MDGEDTHINLPAKSCERADKKMNETCLGYGKK